MKSLTSSHEHVDLDPMVIVQVHQLLLETMVYLMQLGRRHVMPVLDVLIELLCG